MTFREILDIALAADAQARRIHCRFIPDWDKLRNLGLSEAQIGSIEFALAIPHAE